MNLDSDAQKEGPKESAERPLFISVFSFADRLAYLRSLAQGRRRAHGLPPVERVRLTHGQRLWSWAFYLGGPLPWVASADLANRGVVHVACYVLGWVWLLVLIGRKAPPITPMQLVLSLLAGTAACAYGSVALWNSPAVVPLVTALLFFLLVDAVLARVWLRQRRGRLHGSEAAA